MVHRFGDEHASHSSGWSRLSILLLLLAGCALQHGSDEATARLTLDRIFASNEFAEQRPGQVRWLPDSSGYTQLVPAASGEHGRDLVRVFPKDGAKEVLIHAAQLIPKGSDQPLEVADYRWSENHQQLLIFTNTRRVWRQNTRGDYWVLDLESFELKQLGAEAPEASLMFAKLSPDGRRAAYVRANNLYLEELDSGRVTALTEDGSETVVNGTADWVNEEEFEIRDGFRFSPDGTRIAYWQFNTEGVRSYNLINNTAGLYPELTPIPYPKVGQTNSACRIGVVRATSAASQATVWMDTPGDPRQNYIPRMEWAANSDDLVLQRLNRLQNTNQVLLCDARTGAARTVFTDQDEAWVEVCNDLRWLKDGQEFTFLSERDGYNQLYAIARDSGQARKITSGNYDVIQVVTIDEQNGWVYFIAAPDQPTERHLFRAQLDGDGWAERLTPRDQPGHHSYQIAPNGAYALHTCSRIDSPPVTDLVQLPEHESLRTITDNAELRGKVAALDAQPTEFFRIEIEAGLELDAWVIRPPNFRPTRRYPLLFFVYGEPAGSTVQDRWGGQRHLWHRMLAQRGYLVVSVDNRGTKAPRGREWRKCIYRQIGILASADQAAAAHKLIELWPYVDPDRIGIWGWSGGGSMSLNAVFRYPKLYTTAIAIASISNQRFYDTIYQERYMGLPDDNPEGFAQGSPITFAHQLESNLLVIHGTGDDNCHYQSFEALVNELIRHNKSFEMMSYPNRSHGIYEGENTTRHLYGLMTRYLEQHL